jgi:ABC-type transport system involved in cytochrome c biogenesis permease component
VRWLFLKDLQIMRRSPLLVTLLVLYPIVIALLIGFALSRGPDKPEVAFLNQVPEAAEVISLGGEQVDVSSYADELFQAIEPVPVSSREEAVEKVRDGDVLGALIIPPDIVQKLESQVEPATVEVFYNAEDPAKQAFVESTIESQVADANAALTGRFSEIAAEYIDLLVSGGSLSFLGQELDILGLRRAGRSLREAQADLPERSAAHGEIEDVIGFARLARENLALSDDVIRSVGRPIQVDATAVEGSPTPLSTFAVAIAASVSLMFVTLLLAAGMLALEREENAFPRLVRGLVSRTALLTEKVGLAATCSLLVALAMLIGLGLFVELDWGRFPLWLAGLAAGALAFGAMGTAIGALAREVRAASLLAFMLSVPIAFLALVPSGAVSAALFDAIEVVSALFPFEPTLSAMDAALNGDDGIAVPLIHLAALALAFGALGRLALGRFA